MSAAVKRSPSDIGRLRQLAAHQPEPAFEGLPCPADGPVPLLGVGGQDIGGDDGVDRPRQPRFAHMQELQIGGEIRVAGLRRQRTGTVAGQQILNDCNRLDHHRAAVDDRRNEARGIDRQELGVVLDPGEQIDLPQPVGQAQFLEQPGDAETAAFAIDGDHRTLLRTGS
nr:hypothetical protein [Sphingopyxis sp. PET50]